MLPQLQSQQATPLVITACAHWFATLDKVAEFELQLRQFMEDRYPEALAAIRSTGKLAEETDQALKQAISELLERFH